MSGPPQGLRVAELAEIGPGSHAAMVLGGLGAEWARSRFLCTQLSS